MPRPLTGVLATVVTLLLLASGLLAAAEAVRPTRASAQTSQAEVTIAAITPVASRGGEVTASGTVRNTGDLSLDVVNAAFWVSPRTLTSRSSLATAAAEAPGDRLGVRITEPVDLLDPVSDSLAPGVSAPFSVTVPASRLGLTAAGVYPVGIDIRADPRGQLRDTVGRARTFLPYLPAGTPHGRVDVAILAPFTHAPTAASDTTFLDDSLAGDLAPGTRLARLLQAAQSTAVTPVIDPNLVAEALRAGAEHTTLQPPGTAPASGEAAAYATALARLSAGRSSLLLPFADADLVSLEHARLNDPLTDVATITAASATATRLAGRPTAWPADGRADAATLETIAGAGLRQVVLDSAALPDLDELVGRATRAAPAPKTPAAETKTAAAAPPAPFGLPRVTLATPEGALTAIVADQALLAGGPEGSDSALLARQRFLAETSLLALGTPAGATYRVVTALPRDVDIAPRTTEVLEPPRQASWVRVRPLDQVASGPAPRYRGDLSYPPEIRSQELSASVTGSLRHYLDRSQTLRDIERDQQSAAGTQNRSALRGASTAWRSDPVGGQSLNDAMTGQVVAQLSRVQLSVPKIVTLSGSSGAFPVTVTNELDVPVTLYVKVSGRAPVTVDPGRSERLDIDARRRSVNRFTAAASRSGVVSMRARLVSSTGRPVGPPVVFTVRATQYGVVGWLILGAGGLWLVTMAVVRQVRDLRSRRAARETHP